MISPRDVVLARRAKRYGMQNSLRIVLEARRARLPISLAFAIVERESSTGKNIWGGDPGPNGGTDGLNNQLVTEARYLQYRRVRGRGTGGMQGVGPLQLTWWQFQDEADHLGGCWEPKYNLRVGFTHLAGLIVTLGTYRGIKAYNGAGASAEAYALSVVHLTKVWHGRLL